jgi:RNA polymerase sigma-70 factor, ECF subfamily
MEEPVHIAFGEIAETPSADGASFEDLFTQHYARLYGALVIATGNPSEADDIAQDAFVRVLERWDRIARMENPAGYLYRTAMNVFRKRYRRLMRARRLTPQLEPPVDVLGEVEDRDVLLGAMATLPIDQRAALIVTTLFGYSSEEAARFLRTSPSNVRARATRARSAIRATLERET